VSIWKNLGRTIARALRAAARALRRLARRGKDSAAAAAETAAEVAEGAYETGLEVAHDALDLAEHVAAVPGAVLGGLLGARPEQPGDVADAALAADAGPVKAAAPAPVQAIKRRGHVVERVLDYVAGRISREEARFPASVGLWLDDMGEDDREGLLRFPAGDLDRHMTGTDPIVGIPLLPTDAEVRARFQRDGTPVAVALRELEIDAVLERLALQGGKDGKLAEGALARSLARLPRIPADAFVHEAPAMRM
jgi:hypothetical protein